MNQQTIPDKNLPVYLQQFDVKILDDKKESVGKVLYTTTGAITSNKKEKRVWSLNLTGYLDPKVDVYHILYDFSKVDYKENISFEKIISGTFIICGKVLDASKIIGFDYSYSDSESTLTIKLDTSKWDFRLKKEALFSYQLNVDDAASKCLSTCNSSSNQYTIGPDSKVTMIVYLNDCQSFQESNQSCSYYNLIYKPCEEEENANFSVNEGSSTNKNDVIDLSCAYGYTVSDQPYYKGITINLKKGKTTKIIDFKTDPFFRDLNLTGKLSARLDSISYINSTATITFTSSSCSSSTETAS